MFPRRRWETASAGPPRALILAHPGLVMDGPRVGEETAVRWSSAFIPPCVTILRMPRRSRTSCSFEPASCAS